MTTSRSPRIHIPVLGFEVVDSASDRTPGSGADWIPAAVPGGVHESLLAAGRIEHPYADRNERDIGWIEDRTWWYRTTLELPSDLSGDERLRLVCHGLDTVATVGLDGEELGRHSNQHRPYIVDLTACRSGARELTIRFSPPLADLEPSTTATALFEGLIATLGELTTGPELVDDGTPIPATGMFSQTMARASRRRKAMFSWGWDFGPRVPSIGIWEPVELWRERRAAISGHQLRTVEIDPTSKTATVEFTVEVDAFATESPLIAVATLTSPRGVETTLAVALPQTDVSIRTGRATATVEDAEVWWTHDLGGQPLYDLRIDLSEQSTVLDTIHDRVGLRRIELDRSPDPEGGRFFRFILNGVPVFARGGAWLPPSMLVGSTSAERYRDLIRLARDGQMTMLRVWGGGIYEKDDFWRACDEAGVLVWLDFMFACSDYPTDDRDLAAEVELEAIHQVRRLRNRACLALWCGNNEVHMMHESVYGDVEPGSWGHEFFARLLPGIVAEHGHGVPYWAGSPYGEDDPLGVNGVHDGDRHAWEVWHGVEFGTGNSTSYATPGEARHFQRYEKDHGKFISEFGIHASPELTTLERWTAADRLTIHSPDFDHRNKDNPKNKGDALLAVETGLPETMGQYVDATMATQAEGLKFGVEHYRRRQPHTSGTLVWQFNDVWPGFSWSVVDHDLVAKAGYYYLRRAFAPVIASFRRTASAGVELWVANSTARGVATSATIELSSFADGVLLQDTVRAEVAAGAAAKVWESEPGVAATDRFAWVSSVEGAFPDNRLFFDHLRVLPLPADPTLQVSITETSSTTATVEISSVAFAYFVHLPSPVPGVRFSDNYIDLRAGETRSILVEGLPPGLDPHLLAVRTYGGPRP